MIERGMFFLCVRLADRRKERLLARRDIFLRFIVHFRRLIDLEIVS